MIAVVILLRVLARMSPWREQVNDRERAQPPSIKITVLLFLVNQKYMTLSGVSVSWDSAKKLRQSNLTRSRSCPGIKGLFNWD